MYQRILTPLEHSVYVAGMLDHVHSLVREPALGLLAADGRT